MTRLLWSASGLHGVAPQFASECSPFGPQNNSRTAIEQWAPVISSLHALAMEDVGMHPVGKHFFKKPIRDVAAIDLLSPTS